MKPIHSVAMTSNSQVDTENLITKLKLLGYNYNETINDNGVTLKNAVIMTFFDGTFRLLNPLRTINFVNSIIPIIEFNPELFLALACQTSDTDMNNIFVCIKETPRFTLNNFYHCATNNYKDFLSFNDDDDIKNGWSSINNEYFTKATPEQLIRHFKQKPKSMIDFTIKGTKLPFIPVGTKQTTRNNESNIFGEFNFNYNNLVSFGVTNRHNEICVLAEHKDYQFNTYFEIPLSVINKLAEEQNMIEKRKIIGYRVPFDFLSLHLTKGDTYIVESGLLPQEIFEKWEVVYEEKKTVVEKLILGSSRVKIMVSKKGVFLDNRWIDVNSVRQLLSPKQNEVKVFNDKDLTFEDKNSSYKVELIDATYKIGCSTFTLKELKAVNARYNEMKNE